ncbi:hypothetical protein [Robertmurraya andreesenii]|uniref:ABC transporter periplasmic binding protein yphF n=1 Tax=Anoxybacillus andreesenii TaxID=1325932 RepID=A0ABT9V2Q4_9BACL|nr:hypothetical protein [Robertmurraya andreesenii]MDQ0155229.1 hypothetical protein [Robertmurraya andreesenii]
MSKGLQIFLFLLIMPVFLAGCAYPQDRLAQNQIPYQDQIQSVQAAVEQFQKDNGGILPIKTKENDTPIYQKYLIDFKKLIPAYMAEPPGNAFESGGIFQYVLVNVENNPTVKIFDLRIAETIRDIKLRIKMQKFPPYKEQLADHVFSLDFEKLGYKEDPTVTSPFTKQELPFVITGDGEVYVDYLKDLYQILQKETPDVKAGDDIRDILHKDSPFVPAYSLPYTIDAKTNEPIFLSKSE